MQMQMSLFSVYFCKNHLIAKSNEGDDHPNWDKAESNIEQSRNASLWIFKCYFGSFFKTGSFYEPKFFLQESGILSNLVSMRVWAWGGYCSSLLAIDDEQSNFCFYNCKDRYFYKCNFYFNFFNESVSMRRILQFFACNWWWAKLFCFYNCNFFSFTIVKLDNSKKKLLQVQFLFCF